MAEPVKVLFVCLGNICRSPSAEGVFRSLVEQAGLADKVHIDSCGTGHWHIGKSPDTRAQEAAMRRGIDISGLRARQFSPEDLDTFDYVLVMDRQNLDDVKDVWHQNGGTRPALFLEYGRSAHKEVPDPYYGGDQGFETVLDLINEAGEGLLADIRGVWLSQQPEIRENVELEALNTLHVPARARFYVEVHSADELARSLAWAASEDQEVLILGGGSNLVLAGDFMGLVVRLVIRGRRWEHIQDHKATLVLGAGESWHEAVLYAARAGYRGIENLALIPGTAGAAPVQNIGAYGVELCDCLESVTALNRDTGELVVLENAECRFAYRDSLFKQTPGRYVITEIRLVLSRSRPLVLGYRDLQEYLGDTPESALDPLHVAEAVMAIRRRKLPDPDIIPNAGSFFKNPVVDSATFEALRERNPDIVAYPQEHGVKLAAAWLIDQCGWKGFRNARVGVHNRQALVLINHSGGTGADILELAETIRQSVADRFGVTLEMEPGIVGSQR